jgi:AraC-like DNA-binding protein
VIRPVALVLARFGIAADEFLRSVGASGGRPEATVSVVRLAAALDDIAARSRTPHLGLELARMLPLGSLGVPDYHFSTSATLGDALVRAASHLGLFSEARLVIDRDAARIVACQRTPPRRVLTELSSAFAVRRLRDVLGETALALTAVRFTHEVCGPTEPYARYFGVRVTFAAATNDVWFPRALLDAPLLTADPILAGMLVDHPRLVSPTPHDALVGRVRSAIDEALARRGSAPVVDALARGLGMSSRSLQRKLREAGAPYSAVLDGARRDLAASLLARDSVVLVDVARRLGFRSVPAFFRAFRRWTGESPRAFQTARRVRSTVPGWAPGEHRLAR